MPLLLLLAACCALPLGVFAAARLIKAKGGHELDDSPGRDRDE